MANVIKRDGSEESFNEEKIRNSIMAAFEEADISQAKKKTLAKEISDKVVDFFADQDEITTDEIREKILDKMDAKEPKAAEAWRDYEKEKGK